MPAPLSAIDAISPAFQHAKRELFQPYRWGFWLRLALVGVATGEIYGSSGWGGYRFAAPAARGRSNGLWLDFITTNREYLRHYLPLIVLGVLLLIAGVFFWLYVSSVFRFILFDTVLNDRCDLKEGWRRWRSQGTRLFYWWICFGAALLSLLAVMAGAAVFVAAKSGALRNPRQHVLLLVLGGAGCLLALACVFLVAWLVSMFTKNFLVPLMALEDLDIAEGWRRVIVMLKAEKAAYAGYVLVKIILTLGSAILFGLLTLIAVIALLVPLSIAGYAAYALVRAEGWLLNPLTILLAVPAAGVALGLILYTVAFVSAPAMVFFQAYLIHFLASRYSVLEERLAALPGAPPLPGSAASSPAG